MDTFGIITAIVVFIASWIAFIASGGLFGLALGWIPAYYLALMALALRHLIAFVLVLGLVGILVALLNP